MTFRTFVFFELLTGFYGVIVHVSIVSSIAVRFELDGNILQYSYQEL